MKTAIGAIVLAVLLFAAGTAALMQARATRGVAEAHSRLATLQYDRAEVADEAPAGSWWPSDQLDVERPVRAATVSYWRRNYASLANVSLGNTDDRRTPAVEGTLLFLGANSRFRENKTPVITTPASRAAAVEQLDAIIQAYAEVLRVDSTHTDAAYNYEFVGRMRDTIARARPGRTAAGAALAEPSPDDDLPVGPTLHGHPGGPPVEVSGEQFKTLTPMSFEEREEAEPGQGAKPRRRG